eukprot:89113-Rhodomonas_salina.2
MLPFRTKAEKRTTSILDHRTQIAPRERPHQDCVGVQFSGPNSKTSSSDSGLKSNKNRAKASERNTNLLLGTSAYGNVL